MSTSKSNLALSSLAEHIEAVVLALSDQKHDCFLNAERKEKKRLRLSASI